MYNIHFYSLWYNTGGTYVKLYSNLREFRSRDIRILISRLVWKVWNFWNFERRDISNVHKPGDISNVIVRRDDSMTREELDE